MLVKSSRGCYEDALRKLLPCNFSLKQRRVYGRLDRQSTGIVDTTHVDKSTQMTAAAAAYSDREHAPFVRIKYMVLNTPAFLTL